MNKTPEILPLYYIDGVPTVRDSEIINLFRRMKESGRLETTFYDGSITSEEGFLQYMKSPDVALYIFLLGDETVGFAWLTDVNPPRTYAHFCMFPEAGRFILALGRLFLQRLLMATDAEGNYIFDVLLGATPFYNESAIHFVSKCGMVQLGVVPCFVYNAWRREKEDAVLSYTTRAALGIGEEG